MLFERGVVGGECRELLLQCHQAGRSAVALALQTLTAFGRYFAPRLRLRVRYLHAAARASRAASCKRSASASCSRDAIADCSAAAIASHLSVSCAVMLSVTFAELVAPAAKAAFGEGATASASSRVVRWCARSRSAARIAAACCGDTCACADASAAVLASASAVTRRSCTVCICAAALCAAAHIDAGTFRLQFVEFRTAAQANGKACFLAWKPHGAPRVNKRAAVVYRLYVAQQRAHPLARGCLGAHLRREFTWIGGVGAAGNCVKRQE